MQIPEIQYARAGEVRIAYQVFGEGPVDVVVAGGPAGHLEILWEEPVIVRWFERMASFARVAIFDRRGTGASDPGDGPPTLEHYLADVDAVIDACGFVRPALSGGAEGGAMLALYAARRPERVSALVLADTGARDTVAQTPEMTAQIEELIDEHWGKGGIVALYAPSMAGDERFMRWAARLERNAVSPRGARELMRLAQQMDLREDLPLIQAPTLILHRRDDALVPVQEGRELAELIPNARLVEVEGRDTMTWVGDTSVMLDETEEFLTGRRVQRPVERELATIVFTDICGSTELAARLTDARWRDLLAEHDRLVAREVERGGGRVVKSIGDGVLATFASPGGAVRAARAAIEAVAPLGLRIRAGLHTGEIELLEREDVGGIAVNIGARVVDLAPPGAVLVSSTVKDILVGSGLAFEDHGDHELRGVPGAWSLYALADGGVA